MSYVDALWDRDKDIIKVVERVNGQREFKDFPVRYVMYYKDPRGKYKSTFGDSCTRVVCKSWKDFLKEQKINKHKGLFEADINPIYRLLEENYLGKDAPNLNKAFFDIEVDFDPERGYSSPEDPFTPITAITVHLQWLDSLVTLALPPKTLSMEQAKEQCKDFPNTHLFDSEAEMLNTFLDLIQDADIISGWNSEGYDIPYTVNRITRVLSKEDTRRFCLWDQYPKKRTYEKFGREQETYDLIGCQHLDLSLIHISEPTRPY